MINYPYLEQLFLIKGTTTGTVTDMDGNLSVTNVSPESVLVFSFIGMQTIEITVGDQTH